MGERNRTGMGQELTYTGVTPLPNLHIREGDGPQALVTIIVCLSVCFLTTFFNLDKYGNLIHGSNENLCG